MKHILNTIVFLALFIITQPETLKGATYLYTATNFQTTGNPIGALITPMNLSSRSVDIAIIQGSGFGYRDLADIYPESIYVANPTVGNPLWQIYRGMYDSGGPIYFGLISWTDTEIVAEVQQGFGGTLGNFVQLRTYPGLNGEQSASTRGTLTLIPEPTSSIFLLSSILLCLVLRKR